MATLGNPGNTIAIIQKYQFAFQKKFGQNFLIDPHVLDKIIQAAEITREDCVLEIGTSTVCAHPDAVVRFLIKTEYGIIT